MERLNRVVEPGFDRPEPLAGLFGDLLERELGEVAQDDDHSLVGWQPVHGSAEGIGFSAALGPVLGLRLGHAVHRQEPDATPAAQPVATDVDHDPLEPGIEAIRVAEAGEALPGDQRGILDRILGLDLAAKQ
jgi:hypothetical protein